MKNLPDSEDDKEQYLGRFRRSDIPVVLVLIDLGLSLRELIYEFKHQTLVLFKCCLLQPKVYYYDWIMLHLC